MVDLIPQFTLKISIGGQQFRFYFLDQEIIVILVNALVLNRFPGSIHRVQKIILKILPDFSRKV